MVRSKSILAVVITVVNIIAVPHFLEIVPETQCQDHL